MRPATSSPAIVPRMRRTTNVPAAARTSSSGAAPVMAGPSDPREAPVEHQHVAVGREPPAAAQVADEVPVQGARVLAARLRIRAPEREVDGAADLLVEEDRAGRAVDAEVRPDPELAEVARAAVGLERTLEVLVARLGPRRDDLPVAELELDAVDVDARGRRAHGEADPPARARLVRAGEDLAARHVALAVRVDPRAAGDAEREVGAVRLDADVAGALQAGDELGLERAQPVPGRARVGLVE